MKKLLILSAILVSGAVAANAQTTDNNTNVSVQINDVKTIEVLSGDNPSFVLSDEDDYNTVTTSTMAASEVSHIKVVSRGGYKVKATIAGNLTTSVTTAGRKNIPGTALAIYVDGNPVQSSGELAPTPNHTPRAFADAIVPNDVAELVTSPAATGGTRGTTFDVAYTLGNFEDVVNLAVGNFTANLTYTIEAN